MHSNVNPKAIWKFLKIFYNSSIENVIKQQLVEEDGNSFSDFPLSPGTVAYMSSDNSALTVEFFEKIKYWIGSAMTFLSSVMVIVKWFKGKKKEDENSNLTEETT